MDALIQSLVQHESSTHDRQTQTVPNISINITHRNLCCLWFIDSGTCTNAYAQQPVCIYTKYTQTNQTSRQRHTNSKHTQSRFEGNASAQYSAHTNVMWCDVTWSGVMSVCVYVCQRCMVFVLNHSQFHPTPYHNITIHSMISIAVNQSQ